MSMLGESLVNSRLLFTIISNIKVEKTEITYLNLYIGRINCKNKPITVFSKVPT